MKTSATVGLLRFLASLAVCASISAGAQLEVDEPPSPGGGPVTTLTVSETMFTFSGTGNLPPCFVGTTEVSECQFLNESGVDWDIVSLRISPGSEPVGCAALFGFNTCISQQGTDELPSMLIFSGGTGIRVGEILAFSGSGWSSETTFAVTANIPEPGSVTLVMLGVAGFVLLRRRV